MGYNAKDILNPRCGMGFGRQFEMWESKAFRCAASSSCRQSSVFANRSWRMLALHFIQNSHATPSVSYIGSFFARAWGGR